MGKPSLLHEPLGGVGEERQLSARALGPDNYDAPCIVMRCRAFQSAVECIYDSHPIRLMELEIPITWCHS